VPCEGLGYSNAAKYPTNALAPWPSSAPQLHGSADVKDLLDLVPQVAKYINDTFVANPANAGAEYLLFGGRQLTLYLDYLPSRLSQSESLDKAIACVAAALRDICLPVSCRSPAKTLASYTRALNVLQRSLGNAEECLSVEVLCAIQLLGIFEARGARKSDYDLTLMTVPLIARL
jgi:hypothetical protein